MTVTASEYERVAGLDPRAVVRYLRTHAWALVDTYVVANVALPATHAPPSILQVLAPFGFPATGDYPSRIADLLRTLSVVEDGRPDDVLREMVLPSSTSSNSAWIRRTPSGTAASYGHLLSSDKVCGTCWFLLPSACGQSGGSGWSSPSEATTVKEFIAQVRLGQTQAGEYIISGSHTPLPVASRRSAHVSGKALRAFERQVSDSCMLGGLCFPGCNSEYQQDSLTTSTGTPVRAVSNLCEALVKSAATKAVGFKVGFDWSPDLPGDAEHPAVV